MKKLLIILLLILTTGCIKYTDLNDLSIIKSIGIKYDNEYILYAELYSEIKKNTEPKTEIIVINDKNINQLFEKIKKKAKKEIFLSHIDLLVLDSNLNNNNYQEIINFFINNNNIRNDFICIFSNDIESLFKNSHYNEIEDYLNANNEVKNIIYYSFDEIINQFFNNNPFTLSLLNYNDGIIYYGNYQYYNNTLERISNE